MRFPTVSTLALLAALLAGGPLAAMEPAPAGAPVMAAWKETELRFTYIGRTSFYTCRSLSNKVAAILKAVGAREDLVVRGSGCFGDSEIDTFTGVAIKVAMPVVVEAGGLEPDERKRRELVARVRGEPVTVDGIDGLFPARWETVQFDRRSRVVEDGDCELLEQMAFAVFKPLGIEVPRGKIRCIPGEVRPGQVNFDVKVLKAQPKPDDRRS